MFLDSSAPLRPACGDAALSPTADVPRPRLSATASPGSSSPSPPPLPTPHPGNSDRVTQRLDAVIALYRPTPAGAAPRRGIQ